MPPSRSELERDLTKLVQAYGRQADPDLSLQLFRALGWDSVEYRLEEGRAEEALREYRLSVSGETTAFLFVSRQEPHDSDIRSAVNVAYNSGVDWAAVTNFGTTKLLNARWSDEPTYITLNYDEYIDRARDLELLTPQSIVEGRLAQDAEAKQPGRQVLRPVDEHLMDRLESWRRLLLRASGNVTDEQVHELMGRLFFIRSCEDRGIVPKETLFKLRQQADPQALLGSELNQLFDQFAIDFDSELFAEQDQQKPLFDDTVLSEIILELYTPFPGLAHYRYDFSYLSVDVLGKVYERYVSTVLERVPRIEAQPSLFDLGGPQSEIETRSRRREQGIYYTPPYIVNYIVQHTVEQLLKDARTLDEFPRVADISCGSGAFLTRAAERMAARARELDGATVESNWRRWVIARLGGVDADPRAVTLARVNLWILATMGEPPRPLPELGATIIAADALSAPEVDALKGQLDVVVGNPPFRSAAELDRATQERLRHRYLSATGRFDLAYVFMERALQLVRPGGYVGFVVPNRLYTNADARFLRDLLTETATIEKVVDFGHERAFDEGLSYTTILIVRKRVISERKREDPLIDLVGSGKTQVHQVLRLAEYPGLQLRRADLVDGKELADTFSHIFMAAEPSGSGPWIWWASDVEDRIRQKLAAGADTLGSVATLHQGVKTGENRVFLFSRLGTDRRTGKWLMANGRGDHVQIEPDLLRPSVHGGAIGRYGIPNDTGGASEYVLYPYLGSRLLDLFELQATFPATFGYLMSQRDRLARRSTVARGGAWYDLSWPRSEGWLDKPKLLTRELAPQATFAADADGQYVPIGGTALLPRDESNLPLQLLLGVLNSSIMTWYLVYRAAHFQQGYLKIVPGELKAFRFPWDLLRNESALSRRVAALAAGAMRSARLGLPTKVVAEEIDAILFDILGLDSDERRVIREKVSRTGADREEAVPQLLPPETPPKMADRLALVERILVQAEGNESRRTQEEALIRVRNELISALGSADANFPGMTKSLLTFALLSAERLQRVSPTHNQLELLRELLRAVVENRADAKSLRTFERRLRDEGIDVLPSMPGASIALAKQPDELTEDDPGPEQE